MLRAVIGLGMAVAVEKNLLTRPLAEYGKIKIKNEMNEPT